MTQVIGPATEARDNTGGEQVDDHEPAEALDVADGADHGGQDVQRQKPGDQTAQNSGLLASSLIASSSRHSHGDRPGRRVFVTAAVRAGDCAGW